ncbi:MAG: GNAT family N-acetyltransferase [Bacteroidetes bacterium]|nr:MAG: GNAT family N-acetyltransferase [Bacteroidota bacterium]
MTLEFQYLPFAELSVSQLYALLQLRQEVFVVEQFCPYLDADDKDQAAYHLLGYHTQGQLYAYARLLAPGVAYPTYATIGRVVTAPAARGQRIGYDLMQEALAACAHLFPGYDCKISAQAHLQHFYQRLGFVVSGKSYLEDGIPHVPMVRRWS